MQVDERPRGKDPRPDVSKLAVAEPERLDQPFDIHGRRWHRWHRQGRSKLLHGYRTTRPLPSLRAPLQIGEQRPDDLRHCGAEVEHLLATRVLRSDAERRFTQSEVPARG